MRINAFQIAENVQVQGCGLEAVSPPPASNAASRFCNAVERKRRSSGPKACRIPLWTMCTLHSSSATPPIRSSRTIVPIRLLSPNFLMVIGNNGSTTEKVQFCGTLFAEGQYFHRPEYSDFVAGRRTNTLYRKTGDFHGVCHAGLVSRFDAERGALLRSVRAPFRGGTSRRDGLACHVGRRQRRQIKL